MKFCHDKQIHLISNEIYALSVHTEAFGEPFTSALSIETQSLIEPELVHVVWGLSKVCLQDFGATGLRIGCLVSQSNELFLKASTSISLFNFPSSLADNAVTAMFSDRGFTDNFVTVYRKRLHDSYEHMLTTLESHGIPCQKSNATLFIWANLRAAIKDDNIKDDDILRRCREEGVYITSGEGYRSEHSGWFRIVFAHPKQTLDEGLRRIIRTLKTL
ncbi:pyridoxal phosphate-dependent transferase [Xylaria arbuscula]|nr:pyridoxal phosphate-dependent transferase [Xylaria arbuscula]